MMLDWVGFFLSYPIWVRVFVIAAIVAIIIILALVPRKEINSKVSERGQASALNTQYNQNFGTQQNNQVSAQMANFYSTPPSKPERSLKQQIRDILRTINPEIIKRIDSGEQVIVVMINQMNLLELTQLAKDPAFSDYLEIRNAGGTISGTDISMNGYLNDVNEMGTRHGCQFIFKPALKE